MLSKVQDMRELAFNFMKRQCWSVYAYMMKKWKSQMCTYPQNTNTSSCLSWLEKVLEEYPVTFSIQLWVEPQTDLYGILHHRLSCSWRVPRETWAEQEQHKHRELTLRRQEAGNQSWALLPANSPCGLFFFFPYEFLIDSCFCFLRTMCVLINSRSNLIC